MTKKQNDQKDEICLLRSELAIERIENIRRAKEVSTFQDTVLRNQRSILAALDEIKRSNRSNSDKDCNVDFKYHGYTHFHSMLILVLSF